MIRDFRFRNGARLPSLRMHYTTLGQPHRNARGEIDNAVMVLHGTGGTGKQFLQPQFADELYGPGQPLDIRRYWIILPDNIGHGGSSKPSDGLRMRFPAYDYDDMVEAQHRLLRDGLGIRRMRLIMGTSMGCMHSFVWGTTRPDYARALSAAGVPADRDCRAQSHVAAVAGRRDQGRPCMGQAEIIRSNHFRACAPRRRC